MGYASELAIEEHNALLASDAEYAEEYFCQIVEAEAWEIWLELQTEHLTNWFSDYRIDHTGYEEFNISNFDFPLDDDLPF